MPSSKVGIPILSAASARMSKTTRPSFASSFRMPRRSPSSMRASFSASMMAGLFEGRLVNGPRHYRLRARYGEWQVEIEDSYRFPPILSDFDL
jgi:hypothetical protein